jgi:hypothetical protein
VSTLASHLIASFDLEADATNSVSGGQDATLVNSPSFVTANVGNGMDCDATAQSGAVIANADADDWQFGTNHRTVEVWCRPATLPTSGNGAAVVWMGSTGAADTGWHIIYNNSGGTGQFIARLSSGSVLYTATASGYPADGTDYHVVASYYRNGNLGLWVNNVLAATVSISAASAVDIQSDDDVRFGTRHGSQAYLDGIIDVVRLWDFNMSSDGDVVDWLYNGGEGRSHADVAAFNGPWVRSRWQSTQEANTTSLSSTVAIMKSGDLVIHHVTTDGDTASTLAISQADFAELFAPVVENPGSNPVTLGAWYEVIDADDKYTSLTATWTGNERASTVTLVIANPGAIEDIETIDNTTNSTPAGPTTTVTSPGLVIYGVGHDQNTALSSAPSNVLVIGNSNVASTAGTRTVIGRNRPTSAGTFGPGTWTLGGSFNSITFGYHVQGVASGDLEVSGAITQGGQTFSGSAEVVVQAAGSLTQGGATLSGAVDVIVQASGALTQGAATLSASAEALVQLSGALTQGAATISGTIGTPTLSVSGSLTQGGQTLAGTAEALVQASGSLTQGGQVLTGSVSVRLSVSGSLTQGGAVISGSLADPNNQIADIELSAAPLVGIALSATTAFNITLSASPDVS